MSTPLMKAIRVQAYGGPEQLVIDEIPRPTPQAGEILVRVYAAGVLPMETAVRSGMFPGLMPKAFPYTPGTAFAGIVETVGEGVTTYTVGQALCGRAPNGTYAEYVTINIAPAPITNPSEGFRQSAQIIPLADKPLTLSYDEAATLSGGATTAWTSLLEDGKLQAGQSVLIHGAAGGVGLFAVQFAKWKGASHIYATTSTGNVEFVRALGADTVIDYTTTRFEDVVHDVDVVLDAVGGDVMDRSMGVVKRGGTLVSVVGTPDEVLAEKLGICAIHNQVIPNSEHLRQIVQVIDAGYAKPTIQKAFALKDAAQAHALVETKHGRGRVILQMD